jgi:hypothetical protein
MLQLQCLIKGIEQGAELKTQHSKKIEKKKSFLG